MTQTATQPKLSRKEVSKQINQYVLDAIDGSGYERDLKTDKEKIDFLLETFRKEYVFPYNVQRFGTEQNIFTEWCRGLPSCFNIKFYDGEILELGIKWGLITENATERKQQAFINSYWSRLYMNVIAIQKKTRKDPK